MAQNSSILGTQYRISGFRSLLDFSIELTPGINVLVGPNGAGKTNFIDFLDFLDSAIRSNATTAISTAGGVSKVFSLEKAKRGYPVVSAQIKGLANLADARREDTELPLFKFEYEIEIRFNRRQSVIYISKEIIRFFKLHSKKRETVSCSLVGTLSVTRASASDDLPPKWSISARLQADNKRNPLSITPRFLTAAQRKISMAERMMASVFAPDESIFGVRTGFPALEAIRFALTRGRSFNIHPSKVREPDDLAKIPSIMRDGSGLSSTLHYLQQIKKDPRRYTPIRMRNADENTIDLVVEWTKLVLPQLSGIAVTQDPDSGKFLGSLVIGHDKTMRVPFQSASDGTLKWLSLITLVLASAGVYTIEEPENFLHPRMQQFLIQLFRDSPQAGRTENYFIFSTHSETLINQCRPEELILFDFGDSGTVCHRIKNIDDIREEINRTGFGLGYYYANNAIS